MSTRKFSRVSFKIDATVSAAAGQFRGEVQNISLNGMFLTTGERLPEGAPADITISLNGIDPAITVQVGGVVSRITADGLGFTFDRVDLDSYTHLKNIVSHNADDADQIIDEMHHSIVDTATGACPAGAPTRKTTP